MLQSLHIENMAVIRQMDVDFGKGLTTVTGETGSGKSVMIECISFLLGARPARELLRSGAQEGVVSAVFTDTQNCAAYLAQAGFAPSDELLLQRTLTEDGHTRCRLNGQPVTQAILRELGGYLMSIHGQNDNQLLLRPAVQASLLDAVADVGETLGTYREVYGAYRQTAEKLAALRADEASAERLRDILRAEIAEIDAAHLKPGEEAALFARRGKLQHAERISKQAGFAYRVLHGSEKGAATLLLERAAQALSQLTDVIPDAAKAAAKLTDMRYEVEDIANTALDYAEEAGQDTTAVLDRLEGRLATIAKLRRKYGEDEAAVLAFRADAAAKLHGLEHKDEEEAHLRQTQKEQETRLLALSQTLHAARAGASKTLAAAVSEQLAFLDMPSVRFEIALTESADFQPTGKDEITFLIATNSGEPPAPLAGIASGGELARVMLALRSVLNDRDGVGTAVFDEVDTGISGKTARKIGIKLAEIGRYTQVICITHSAQIASLAQTHLKIAKHDDGARAFTEITVLDEEGRVSEVSRILGGLQVTEAQRNAAVDMIEEGKQYR